MKVLVKFAGRPYDIIKKSYLWLFFNDNEVTLEKLLNKLEVEAGVTFKQKDAGIIVLVNGRLVDFSGGAYTKLKDLDEVLVASIVGGG